MKKLLQLTVVVFMFFVPAAAHAGRLYILPQKAILTAGENFDVQIRLDTQSDEINAVDLQLQYSKDLMDFVEGQDGSSLVNVWLEKAQKIDLDDCETGLSACSGIHMSGLAPGGFSGDGLIIQLTFKALRNGEAQVVFDNNSQVFLNSPDAKPVFLVFNGAQFDVGGAGATRSGMREDKKPPESFAIYLDRTPDVYDNKWFLSFAAQDKGSGIQYYEVQERILGLVGGGWQKVENPPYILKHQALFSVIRVRAIDQFGNISSSTLIPSNMQVVFSIGGLIAFSVIILAAIRIAIRRLPRLPVSNRPVVK